MLPYTFQLLNNLAWMLYGYSLLNVYIIASNAPAFILAFYFVLHTFKMAPADTSKTLATVLISGLSLQIVLSFIASFFLASVKDDILGYSANFFVMFMYGGGLSSIKEVLLMSFHSFHILHAFLFPHHLFTNVLLSVTPTVLS